MCRYGFVAYKTHFACLPCRRSFKHDYGTTPRCPQCRQPMLHMGRDFHPPRRRDLRQWRKVALLVASAPGRRDLLGPLPPAPLFDSCGCTGPGPRPRTLADARTQFGLRRSARRHYSQRPSSTRQIA